MTIFFLSILTLIVAYTSLTLFQQKSDGLTVNIAGRQRMLTQKFTKEFFLSLQKGKGRSELTEKTRKLFDVSLTALQSGGETFKDV
ncbi:MAG: methyl-accepting chemotaxis protein, partial [Desulfocapsa sp.]